MKKKIFFLPLLAIAIAACDTSIEDSGHPSPAITAAELQNRVTLTQTGTENAFTYSTSPALPVQVLDQDGNILASGVAGTQIVPSTRNIAHCARYQSRWNIHID